MPGRLPLPQDELYRQLVDDATDAMLVYDADSRICFANRAFVQISGYSAEELQRLTLVDLVHPDDHSVVTESFRRRLSGRSAPRRYEVRAVTKAGKTLWIDLSASPLKRDGELVGAHAIVRDITRKRHAEAALERLSRQNELILNAAGEGSYVLDPAGRATFVNPAGARMTGYDDVVDLLGWPLHEKLGHADANGARYDANECPVCAVAHDRLTHRGTDACFTRRDGTQFPVEYVSTAMREADEIVGTVVVFQDITERKRIETELARARDDALEASRAKSTFLANMSHELRTPLNAIIGYSEMLQEEARDYGADPLVVDLEKIQTAGKHLLKLINGILDLSKIEAGKMELYLETFQIADLLQDVAITIQPLVAKNGNTLTVECSGDAGALRADLTKVRQTLFNLLSNAAKFTHGGRIELRAERESAAPGDRIVFSIADTGIGMSAEELGRLFQDFTQADASTTRKYGGTGLGLALSRRFVQMMGGEIAVDSRPGEGSAFTVRLPAVVAERRLELAPVVSQVSAGPETGSLVLVVDDDPAVQELMQRFLTREGFRVASATDGATGLRLAKEYRPAVITLDVLMPGLDGWAVLTALKADPELADIPVIVLTMLDDRNLGYALGATEYLAKPIDRERLLATLRRYRREGAGTVLLVEDDGPTREMLRRMLEREGYEVDEAENGRVGLERVAAQPPALILLDLMMPELDGFEVVATLRQHEEWRTIPVIVVTAKDLTPAERQRLNGSVEKILRKGALSREDLLREVGSRIAAYLKAERRF
ncbi:MAG: response regulator [Chloroflexi bacterium]|nr:response regulator [Chloroflexota bacterium]